MVERQTPEPPASRTSQPLHPVKHRGVISSAHGGRPQGPLQPGTAARVPKSKTENVNRSGHSRTYLHRPLALIATLKASLCRRPPTHDECTRTETAKAPATMDAIEKTLAATAHGAGRARMAGEQACAGRRLRPG